MKEDVLERFAAALGGGDGDEEFLAQFPLADDLIEAFGRRLSVNPSSSGPWLSGLTMRSRGIDALVGRGGAGAVDYLPAFVAVAKPVPATASGVRPLSPQVEADASAIAAAGRRLADVQMAPRVLGPHRIPRDAASGMST